MQFTADLVTFTKKILNGKLHFLCSAIFVASLRRVFVLLRSHEKYFFSISIHLLKYFQARYWPPYRVQDQKSYETNYDPSSLHHQSFVLPNLKANTEYVLAVAVKTTGGPSDGSSKVQFKTTEGGKINLGCG